MIRSTYRIGSLILDCSASSENAIHMCADCGQVLELSALENFAWWFMWLLIHPPCSSRGLFCKSPVALLNGQKKHGAEVAKPAGMAAGGDGKAISAIVFCCEAMGLQSVLRWRYCRNGCTLRPKGTTWFKVRCPHTALQSDCGGTEPNGSRFGLMNHFVGSSRLSFGQNVTAGSGWRMEVSTVSDLFEQGKDFHFCPT